RRFKHIRHRGALITQFDDIRLLSSSSCSSFCVSSFFLRLDKQRSQSVLECDLYKCSVMSSTEG
ncbi:unnamed protein product, partial [Amoebophrya sp. A120]